MPYIHFTEEQKQRSNSVDMEESLLRSGEFLLSSGREKRMAGDHSVPYAAASGTTMRCSGAAGRWPSSGTFATCPPGGGEVPAERQQCGVCGPR